MMVIEIDETRIKIPNFDRDDFDCPCCGANLMKDMFIWKLQYARTEARIPFVVNSGFRCEKHNKDVGGEESSDHLTGEAADIKCLTSHERYKMIECGLRAGFRRIGIGGDFIHFGDNWSNPQEVIWLY